jgi:hypothetical protein
MYQKPKVERFGSFRELTQWGGSGLFLLQSATGCKNSGGRPPGCKSDNRS